MSLGIGSSVAQSGLAVTAEQIATVSRNVARAGDPDATRKAAIAVTGPGGTVRIGAYVRSANPQLLDNYLSANASTASQQAVADALTALDATIGDTAAERSPAAYVGRLTNALQQYSSSPSNSALGGAVVTAANDLVRVLNSASKAVATVRQGADTDIATSVGRINGLLADFGDQNLAVINGLRTGADVTDALDARDGILKKLSDEIGITTIAKPDGGLAIYTDSGVTLFERSARTVSFTESPGLTAAGAGAAVYVDGVPVAGTPQALPIKSGRLTGLVTVRDQIAPVFQNQIDEIARGLIEAFAETDQTGGGNPDAAGLFTYSGAPAIPPGGSVVKGLAGEISVNATVDPAQGGDIKLLRDGGISSPGNPAYSYNTTGAAAFNDRIEQLLTALTSPRAFDAAALTSTSSTISNFASASVSWLQENRKSSDSTLEYRQALSERATATLSQETGVNLDEEMAHLLELERTYQASARIITAIDQMLQSLLQATG